MKYLILASMILVTGCSDANAPSAPSSATVAMSAADLAFCVSDLNGYRARVNLSPLSVTGTLNDYAAQGAQADSSANTPHSHFTAASGPARAENELLNQGFGSVRDAISALDGISWSEGPSGGHYRNMTGAYTQIGCGAFVQNGAITVVQDFR